MNTFCEILIGAAVYIPLAGALAIALLFPFMGARSSKVLALLASGTAFVCSVIVWGIYADSYAGGVGFAFSCAPSVCGMLLPPLGLNGISAPLFALAGIVSFCACLWSGACDFRHTRLYYILLLFMAGGLMGAFSSTNVLWMYMFHEFALVPTFIAMLLWGGAGRGMAAMQMAVYLTLGALVSLVGVIALYAQSGADDFSLISMAEALARNPIGDQWQYVIFALLLFGLGTLVSLFPFYSWAPRGYSAAPTAFSMLHAGVLKKFGLYLLLQFAVPLLPSGCSQWAWALAVLALCNVVYIGLVTMAQRDLKMMISYSSVSHMGLCFLALCSMSVLGAGGALLLMFGHGLSVALLFLLCGYVTNRTGEWDMFKMGGLYKRTPLLAGFFLAAIMASIGLPGFPNFWGELSILLSLWKFSPAICAIAATGIIISAIYALRAFARVFMGEPKASLPGDMPDISLRERMPAIILLAFLLIVGFFPRAVSDGADATMSAIPSYNQSK